MKLKSVQLWLMIVLLLLLFTGCSKHGQEKNNGEDPAGEDAGASEAPEDAGETVIWRDTGETAVLFFSRGSGAFPEKSLTVDLKAPEGYTLAYTTDGSVPAEKDAKGVSDAAVTVTAGDPSHYLIRHRDAMACRDFEGLQLKDDETLPGGTVLTVCLVRSDGAFSDPAVRIYFPGIDFGELYPGCLILSVYTDPAGLLDYETGILASGAVYDAWRETEEGKKSIADKEWWFAETNSIQKGKAWERACLLQIYEGGGWGAPVLETAAGMRVQGGMSRRNSQKSFNLYFRKEYGASRLNYPLFPGVDDYKSFTLRNGGNTADGLKFKDPMLRELADDRAFTVMRSRPAVLFLNGEYWGPYNLDEKMSSETLANRFGLNKDRVAVIKEGAVEDGTDEDLRSYEEMMAFEKRDLSDPAVYGAFCSVMDVQSMADYYAARIYTGAEDWRQDKNVALWRTRDDSYREGRWQYILYDTEFSTGEYGYEGTSYATDHLRIAFGRSPLFAAAMQNKDFSRLFLNAIREIGRENYSFERVEAAMDEYSKVWEKLMPDFYRRFGSTGNSWSNTVKYTVPFFRERYDHIIPLVEEWVEK